MVTLLLIFMKSTRIKSLPRNQLIRSACLKEGVAQGLLARVCWSEPAGVSNSFDVALNLIC